MVSEARHGAVPVLEAATMFGAKKAAKGKATENLHIDIKALQTASFEMLLIGDTPLIMNSWTQKGKLEMLKKHMQLPTIREAKDPQDQFLQTIYRLEDGAYGFPVVGVKEAMATATTELEGIFRTQIYRNIFVTGRRGFQRGAFCDILSPIELAEVFSPNAPVIREDIVRLAGAQRTPDLRYRSEFFPWALRLQVSYVRNFVRDSDIFNLAAMAGFTIGLGEWRQEKGGTNGRFHVATEADKKMVAKWIKAGQKEPKLIDVSAWRESVRDKGEPAHAKVPAAARKAKKTNGAEVHA
jgi:hypothetical protein